MFRHKLLVCGFLLFIISFSQAEDNEEALRRPGRPRKRRPTISRATSLEDILSSGYDYRQVPGADRPTEVRVGIYINSFRVSSDDMSYRVTMYLRQQWLDPRLEHRPPEHSRKNEIRLHSDDMAKVWRPDMFFRNEIKSHFHDVTVHNRFNEGETGWDGVVRAQSDGYIKLSDESTVLSVRQPGVPDDV